MKINNKEVLITKIEAKKNKEGSDYISISFLDLLSGDNFNVITKDIEYMKLKPMTKYNINLNLSSNRYGIKLEFEGIGKELGGI